MSDHPGPRPPSPVRPGAGGSEGDWMPVAAGESGAAVFRNADATRYAKCVPAAEATALEAERDRVAWLGDQGIPGPRVLDWHFGDTGACLVTSAVSGVPADQVSAADLQASWGHIAEAVRRLHELPVSQCPFHRDLDTMIAMARDVVARDAVNPEFLLAGFLDPGRLGSADRHADLALLLANARETWNDEEPARAADAAFAETYGIALDHDRLRFYLHLDPLTWG
ncbi:phosphotransferase [Streptomyces sp. NPDC001262]|uniref:phosphotransferase n=1 Tax=Streptomyces sp. NPDC001262 TaxID=3364552 RepID=UPI0036C69E61